MSESEAFPPARVREIRFLREYAAFSCHQPLAVAEALFPALCEAYGKSDYGRVGHLLLGLHSEMTHAYEAAGALLLALSRGSEPGAILVTLWSYGEGEVAKFLEGLAKSEDWLAYVGLPGEPEVSGAFGERAASAGYSHEGLKTLLETFVGMYTNKDVRGSYNKIKHGLLMVRHPDLLSDDPKAAGPVEGDQVYVLLRDQLAAFPGSTPEAVRFAFVYLSNTRQISEVMAAMANLAAECLNAGLNVGTSPRPS